MTRERTEKDHAHEYVYDHIDIRKTQDLCFRLSNVTFGNNIPRNISMGMAFPSI